MRRAVVIRHSAEIGGGAYSALAARFIFMSPKNARIRATAFVAAAFVGSMLVTVSYAPDLYRIFCSATGYGGTPRRATGASDRGPAADRPARKLTVLFDSNVAPGLDWDFRPEQRSVDVEVGIPVTIYYEATNRSDKAEVARAVYNVTPSAIAPYFYKIQCFCFTEEKLDPHETAKMPVVFYIDDAMLNDSNTSGLSEVTLSYTFYNQKGLMANNIDATRDLKIGSALETRQKITAASDFENDAQRRQEP